MPRSDGPAHREERGDSGGIDGALHAEDLPGEQLDLVASRRHRREGDLGRTELNERLGRIVRGRREATAPGVQALDIDLMLANELEERAARVGNGVEDEACVGGRPTRLAKDADDG